MPVKAVGRQVGISTKRLRPVLRALRGMRVQDAIEALRFQPGPTVERVSAILRSAAANAENNNAMDPTRLKVVGAFADQAVFTRRFRARSTSTHRGREGQPLSHHAEISATRQRTEPPTRSGAGKPPHELRRRMLLSLTPKRRPSDFASTSNGVSSPGGVI